MIGIFLLCSTPTFSQAPNRVFDPSHVGSDRRIISKSDYTLTNLFAYGDKLFPAFSKILTDEKSTNGEISNTYRTPSIIDGAYDYSTFIALGKALEALTKLP